MACRSTAALGVHHEVEVARNVGEGLAKNLTEKPLDAVAHHGTPDFPRDRYSEAMMTQAVFAAEEHEPFRMEFHARVVHRPVVRPVHDAVPPGKPLVGRTSHSP